LRLLRIPPSPPFFGIGDSDELLKSSSFNIVSVPYYQNVAHLKLKFHQEGTSIYIK